MTFNLNNEEKRRKVLQVGGAAAFIGASLLMVPPLRGKIEESAYRRESLIDPPLTPLQEEVLRAKIKKDVDSIQQFGWALGLVAALSKILELLPE